MRDNSTFPVLLFFAIGIMIVLITGPSPGSSSSYDSESSSYNSSYSSSNELSQQSSGTSLDGLLVGVLLVIGIPLLLSFKPVRSAISGTAGGLIGHPKGIIWFVVGFVGTAMILMSVNPDPTTYEIPPLFLCLGGGMALSVLTAFK